MPTLESSSLHINQGRFEARLSALAQIGSLGEGQGITRRALSPEEDEAKALIRSLCDEEGISARQDGAGNLIARVGPDGPSVMTGSHIDTVPKGGHLDGAYGVIAGLEALSCLKSREAELKRAVELAVFTDEEGRFGSMIGSKCMSGDMNELTLRQAQDETGRSLEAALAERGMSIKGALGARREAHEVERFIELHIEQGPVLEQRGMELGVVEEIVGIIRWRASYHGEANHAGTTPMELRRDAFMGLTRFAQQLTPLVSAYGSPAARVTIGEVSLSPGYIGVIPAEARFTLDLRDISLEQLQATNQALRAAAQEVAEVCQLRLELEEVGHLSPTRCDPEIVNQIEQLAQRRGYRALRTPSGATHDAVPMSTLTRVGMIFAPSERGVSHSPYEHTSLDSLAQGANLLLDTLQFYATRS